MTRHPFARLPEGLPRRLALLALFVFFLAVSRWMKPSNDALVGPGTETAIVALELAGTVARASEVVSLWQAKGALDAAVVNVQLDYLFLVAYGSFLALAVAMSSDVFARWPRLARAGVWLSWGTLLAATFDGVENVGLMVILGDPAHIGSVAPAISAACASAKFALLVPALLYAVAGGLAWIGLAVSGRLPGKAKSAG